MYSADLFWKNHSCEHMVDKVLIPVSHNEHQPWWTSSSTNWGTIDPKIQKKCLQWNIFLINESETHASLLTFMVIKWHRCQDEGQGHTQQKEGGHRDLESTQIYNSGINFSWATLMTNWKSKQNPWLNEVRVQTHSSLPETLVNQTVGWVLECGLHTWMPLCFLPNYCVLAFIMQDTQCI